MQTLMYLLNTVFHVFKFHNLELGDLIGVRGTGYHFITATVDVHTPPGLPAAAAVSGSYMPRWEPTVSLKVLAKIKTF